MLSDLESDEVNGALRVIGDILQNLPYIHVVEKAFVFSREKIPDPIRFICKGDEGSYALVFYWEYIQKWQGKYEVMAACLEQEIIARDIMPSKKRMTYICTSTGLLKV